VIIYLTRHGQTTGDIENRYGGDYDDHLTDIGKQQSAQLAERLSNKGIGLLFASPLIRTKETATVIAERLSLVTNIFDDFRERNSYGILTGMTKDEALQKYPDQIQILKDVRATVEGAEEYASFQQRIINALATISQEQVDRIAIVTHGGPMRLIFRDILELGEIDVDDCAFAVLEADNDTYTLLDKSGITIKKQLS